MGDMGNPFYADLANIIQKHLAKHNYMMVLFNSEYNTEQELEFIKKAELFHFDGTDSNHSAGQGNLPEIREASHSKSSGKSDYSGLFRLFCVDRQLSSWI